MKEYKNEVHNPERSYVELARVAALHNISQSDEFLIICKDKDNCLKIWAAIPDHSEELQILKGFLENGMKAVKSHIEAKNNSKANE